MAELNTYRVLVGGMDREDSPDLEGVGYIEEDHPLRPSLAAQSVALLQVAYADLIIHGMDNLNIVLLIVFTKSWYRGLDIYVCKIIHYKRFPICVG